MQVSVLAFVATFLILLQCCCSYFIGDEHARFVVGPGRQVLVYTRGIGPDGTTLFYVKGPDAMLTSEVFRTREDHIPRLAEVAVDTEGSTIFGLICNAISTTPQRFSFNLLEGALSDSLMTNRALEEALRGRYLLTSEELSRYGSDAIRWACDPRSDAWQRFETARSAGPLAAWPVKGVKGGGGIRK